MDQNKKQSEEDIRELIRKEIIAALSEQKLNDARYKPHEEYGEQPSPEEILTDADMVESHKNFTFRIKKGDKVLFDIEKLKYNEGTVIGFDPEGDRIYVKLPTKKYIPITLSAIKKVEISDARGNWVLQPQV